MAKKKEYGDMETPGAGRVEAPRVAYQPPRPRRYSPPIGLIGCGGITKTHLAAYREMGLDVVALCDPVEAAARERQAECYPEADLYTDYRQLLKRDDIEVVDIATHPQDRDYLIPAALEAGKHVLSQKPFVMNLSRGEAFADLAEKKGVKLAVNQNGRWAPYVSYARHAVAKGVLGDVFAAHVACHWNHEWIESRPFNRVHHIILYDFAIHWFDMIACYIPGRTPTRVQASITRAEHQTARPPLLGQVMIEFDGAQASMQFDATVRHAAIETVLIAGTKGTLDASGGVCSAHNMSLHLKKGVAKPKLEGTWFKEGFMGTMGELLSAIEQKRTPENNARDNLRSLAMCFAAIKSAETGRPQVPGKVRAANRQTCSVAPE
jgi:predicted dehydrogenase